MSERFSSERQFGLQFKKATACMMLLERLVDLTCPAEVLTAEEVDAELRRAGLNPEEVGNRMQAIAKEALAAVRCDGE